MDIQTKNIESYFAPTGRVSGQMLQNEKSAVANNKMISTLLNAMPDLLLVLNECRQIVAVNSRLLDAFGVADPDALLGLRPGEAVGCIPFIFYTATFTTAQDEELALKLGADRFLVKPMEPDVLAQVIKQVLAAPRPEARLQTPNGERQVLQEYSEALFRKLEKKMMELEQANRDLIRKNEELHKTREEADCANRAKLRFLNTVSHELRTPLNTILGALQLSEIDQAYDQNMTLEAKAALFSMLEMIDNILETSRLEAGAPVFRQGTVDLELLVTTLNRLFAVAVQNKGLALRFSLADDLPRQFLADSLHLQQVLAHLINNAIKFTLQGEVEVRFRREVDPVPGHTWLVLEVQDSGVGIDPEKQRQVFELFTQADDSTTRAFGGVGLGLNLTKRLVELMGGTISLQSVVGVGSTFTVRLPLPSAS